MLLTQRSDGSHVLHSLTCVSAGAECMGEHPSAPPTVQMPAELAAPTAHTNVCKEYFELLMGVKDQYGIAEPFTDDQIGEPTA